MSNYIIINFSIFIYNIVLQTLYHTNFYFSIYYLIKTVINKNLSTEIFNLNSFIAEGDSHPCIKSEGQGGNHIVTVSSFFVCYDYHLH